MSYEAIDIPLRAWAQKHALSWVESGPGGACWCAYLSSVAGECFQIWVDPPSNCQVYVYVGCVEGRRDEDAPRKFATDVSDLDASLDSALACAVDWMKPSTRFTHIAEGRGAITPPQNTPAG